MRFASVVGRLDSTASRAWEIHAEGARRMAAGEDVILLSIGDPDFATPDSVVTAARESLLAGRTKYGAFAGEPVLREAIARRHADLCGAPLDPTRVTVFAGAQNALFATAMCLVERGDEVLMPEPRYVTYEAVVDATGATVRAVPLDVARGFHLDLDALADAITPHTRMILLNSPHNPTGAVFTPDELSAVAALARKHDLWVVCDEVYAELTFDAPHAGIGSLAEASERCVTIGSLSKSHAMQGWRVGWTVAPPALARHLENLIKPMHYGLSPFVQDAAVAALTGGMEDSVRMRATYRERRDVVCARMDAVEGVSCRPPEGGMFVFLDVRETGLDGEQFAWGLLEQAGVSLLPGLGFGPSAAGHVRLSLGASREVLEAACSRISDFVHLRQPPALAPAP